MSLDYMYFEIKDARHGKYILGGQNFDGKAYCGDASIGDVAQWRFEKLSSGRYHIYDRLHNQALIGGAHYDAHMYHGAPNGALNAEWELRETDQPGVFHIVDGKHHKAIDSGNNYDGHLYHSEVDDRRNVLWSLLLKQSGEKGPQEYIAEEKLRRVDFHDDKATVLPAPDIILKRTYDNQSNIEQQFTAEKIERITVSEHWDFSIYTTVGLLTSLTASASGGIPGAAKAKISATVEMKLETTMGYAKGVTKTQESEIRLSLPVTVPPKKKIEVIQTHKCDTKDIPFTVYVDRVLGNGKTVKHQYDGVWRGMKVNDGVVTTKFV